MRNQRWVNITKSVMMVLVPMLLYPATARAEPPSRELITTIHIGALRDINGSPVTGLTDPSTALYTIAPGNPPLEATDGHQITFGEWIQTAIDNTSRASVKCVNKGTHVSIHATDLVANGLYTAWLFVLATPASPLAIGAVPTVTGQEENSFRASHVGEATFNAIVPAGPLSISGSISSCLLDNSAFILRLAYHSDDQLYGGMPGPVGVTLDHIGFTFLP
jgi:hypothetical protein